MATWHAGCGGGRAKGASGWPGLRLVLGLWLIWIVQAIQPLHAHEVDAGAPRGTFHAEAPGTPGGIAEVLDRSQRMRLAALREAEPSPESVEVIRASFNAVMAAWPRAPQVTLLVTRAPVIAESLLGRVIVASEALAGLPEAQRRFVLAHELGHVIEGHWARMGLLYRKHVPGAVDPEHTQAVAHVLGREASALAHEQELAADAFGLRLILGMGHEVGDALAAFRCFGALPDTATHPGTRKRVAHLHALMASPALSSPTTAGVVGVGPQP